MQTWLRHLGMRRPHDRHFELVAGLQSREQWAQHQAVSNATAALDLSPLLRSDIKAEQEGDSFSSRAAWDDDKGAERGHPQSRACCLCFHTSMQRSGLNLLVFCSRLTARAHACSPSSATHFPASIVVSP